MGRKINNIAIISIVFLLFPFSAVAQQTTIDAASKMIANQLIIDIYYDILDRKQSYPELLDFDTTALLTNQHDIFTIIYKATVQDNQPYEFAVTIVMNQDRNFLEKGKNAFNYIFPWLDIKIAGYKINPFPTRLFDVTDIVQKRGNMLWEYQQQFMPLQLELTAAKDSYKPGEDIEFTVSLKNMTKTLYKVNDLSDKTLFFVYHDKVWGARETNPNNKEEGVILNPGGSIKKKFTGNAFGKPQEFEIYASYNMAFKGVKPAGKLKIRVADGR